MISPGYLEQQRVLHEKTDYGVASGSWASFVKHVIDEKDIKSVSDYGAGKCRLKSALAELGTKVEYFPFDPVFPEYGKARTADLVCCIDVLEHIEPEYLDAVLSDLRRLTINIGLYTIHTGPANKFLPDGRNAHLTQRPTRWWLPKLCGLFDIKMMQGHERGFAVVVT